MGYKIEKTIDYTILYNKCDVSIRKKYILICITFVMLCFYFFFSFIFLRCFFFLQNTLLIMFVVANRLMNFHVA